MNNEMFLKIQNNKMNYNNNYDINNYQINSNTKNYLYTMNNQKAQMMNTPKNIKLNYNNSKSPNNFDSYKKFNNNTYNNYNRNNIIDKNLINNNLSRTQKQKSFSQKDNNNTVGVNKAMEIQERFDRLQDKINYLQNVITNKDPVKDLMQNEIIVNNDINYYKYQPKFNNNTYNSRFTKNNFNNTNNSNFPKIKDLNEIHNRMQNVNPRASLIKKMTSYRTTHVEENKPNNIINNIPNKKVSNNNIKNNRIINNKKNMNNRKNMQNIGNTLNNTYTNNNINKAYFTKVNIPNNNINFQFNKNSKKVNLENNNIYNRGNLFNFDINKYPHEIDQINDLDDIDINNKTFNFGDNNKFKNEFLIDNTNYIGNNNYIYKNNGTINNNNLTINRNYNINNINNKMIKSNNKKNIINNNLNNNIKNNINDNNENEEESSENLSDIAEEILDTFQGSNYNENDINSYSNPTKEIKVDDNLLISNTHLRKQKSNNIIEFNNTKPFQNEISDFQQNNRNLKKENGNGNIIKDNKSNKNKEIEIGIQTSPISNNNDFLYNENDLIKNNINNELQEINDINLNTSPDQLHYKYNSNANSNIINNKNIDTIKDKDQKPINISNNITTNINNNINNINNKINNNDEKNNLKPEGMVDKKDFIQNINNLNIMKSLIIINNNDVNSKDNPIPALQNIQDSDINLNNINNNLIKDSNQQSQITNSNIVFNISYSKDSQITSENKLDQKNQENKIKNEVEQLDKKYIKEEKNSEEQNKSTTTNEQDSLNKKKLNEEIKNKEKTKKKNNRIQINLDYNIYYHYKKDSCLDDYYETYNKNDEFINLNNNKIFDLDNYMKTLKNSKNLVPSIKKYDKNSIKIKEDYKECENLSEREIIPDLYEEEEEDIRSLEKSLERSIDKSFDKSYDKWYGQSLNDKMNEPAVNDSYNMSYSNINDSYANNNTGRKIINQLQEMFIEEVDEEQNEENEKDDKKDILIDEEKK